MNKYKRYKGVGILVLGLVVSVFLGFLILNPQIIKFHEMNSNLEQAETKLSEKQKQKENVDHILKNLRTTASTTKKTIYAPDANIDGDVNDVLFYTLYKDLIEMIRNNSIKVKSMDYTYNPEDDEFVKNASSKFFVTEVNMDLVSNYINLGKFIEAIYQYNYYIRIMKIEVTPYPADKKILTTNCVLRLYARTAPAVEELDLIE